MFDGERLFDFVQLRYFLEGLPDSRVDAKDFLIDDCSQRQIFKDFVQVLKNRVLVHDILSKSLVAFQAQSFVDVDLFVFVSSSQKVNRVGELEFEGEKGANDFQGILSAIDIIAEEDVVLGFYVSILDRRIVVRSSVEVEEAHQVSVLSMKGAKDLNSRAQLDNHVFLLQDLNDLFAESYYDLRLNDEVLVRKELEFVGFQ